MKKINALIVAMAMIGWFSGEVLGADKKNPVKKKNIRNPTRHLREELEKR